VLLESSSGLEVVRGNRLVSLNIKPGKVVPVPAFSPLFPMIFSFGPLKFRSEPGTQLSRFPSSLIETQRELCPLLTFLTFARGIPLPARLREKPMPPELSTIRCALAPSFLDLHFSFRSSTPFSFYRTPRFPVPWRSHVTFFFFSLAAFLPSPFLLVVSSPRCVGENSLMLLLFFFFGICSPKFHAFLMGRQGGRLKIHASGNPCSFLFASSPGCVKEAWDFPLRKVY